MDERYWDQLAPSYRAQVHNSLLADRDGVIERWLDEFAAPRKAAVDFGCGVGNYLAALSNRFKLIHALDHSARLLDQARAAHRDLNNIMYRKADLSKPLRDWKRPHVGICMNVLIAPDHELRSAMVKTMHQALAPGGHLLAVVPALESALYTDVRLVEWSMRDGMTHARALRDGLRGEPGVIGPLASGVIDRGGVPTKHYLCEEAVLMLRQGGFEVEVADKVEFAWSAEFIDPPRWLRDPYPWHWLLVCRRA